MPKAGIHGADEEPFNLNGFLVAVQADDPHLFLFKRNMVF